MNEFGNTTFYGEITQARLNQAEEDLRFSAVALAQPASGRPDFDTTNIGYLFPQNNTAEVLFIIAQMPHSWNEGGKIYPHVHVMQSANLQAVFKIDYKWYNSGDTEPATWTTYTMNSYTDTYTTGTISNMIKGAGIDGTGKTASSILKIKLYRDDNVYTGDILLDEFDIHYQVKRFGKDLEGSY